MTFTSTKHMLISLHHSARKVVATMVCPPSVYNYVGCNDVVTVDFHNGCLYSTPGVW